MSLKVTKYSSSPNKDLTEPKQAHPLYDELWQMGEHLQPQAHQPQVQDRAIQALIPADSNQAVYQLLTECKTSLNCNHPGPIEQTELFFICTCKLFFFFTIFCTLDLHIAHHSILYSYFFYLLYFNYHYCCFFLSLLL